MRRRVSTSADNSLRRSPRCINFEWRAAPVAKPSAEPTDPVETAVSDRIDMWERMREWSARRFPMLEWAVIWFREQAPQASRISVVHGDYRIGNFLVDRRAHHRHPGLGAGAFGDPNEDLGWISMQAWRGRSPYLCHLFESEEMLDRYNALTGFGRTPPKRALLGSVRDI